MTNEEIQAWMDANVDDDTLVAIATTCSNAGVRLSAEIQLRKRYPSIKAAKMLKKKGARKHD